MKLPDNFHGQCKPEPIPKDLLSKFTPATHYFHEWRDYWLRCSGADRLRVGGEWQAPQFEDWFCVRFENQLGLATLQPYAGQHPLEPPLHVEVISPKFPTLDQHLNFFRALLDDLFARAARLPFTVSAPTGRGVTESLRPPTPLFTLHFLCQCQHKCALETALAIVLAEPHRKLHDCPDWVPLIEATEADADVLVSILHTPDTWTRARGFTLATRLRGYAPTRVWQRRSEETFDTPENRFVLAFLREVLTAAEALPAQPWWNNVPAERQHVVRQAASLLRRVIAHPLFDDVGAMEHFPSNSQVLLRREGYRDLLNLWQTFHHARRPLFEPLRQAMEVRDVATLYETWAFFALTEDIAVLTDQSPVIDLHLSDKVGLNWQAEARFGAAGKLVYNQSQPSYSVPLRPDFTWMRDGQAEVVLDAKFRLERLALEDDGEDTPEATARRADLYKMHTYRDALGVRAAAAIYPGTESVFYDHQQKRLAGIKLGDVLNGNLSGIGALVLRPSDSTMERAKPI
jgi:predicted component of viral defense system (DUF524 family)